MSQQRPVTNLSRAVFFVLLASFFNTLMIFFVKLASASLSIPVILFARFFITLVIIIPFIFYHKDKQSVATLLKTKRLPLHLFRDVLGLTSVFCFFYTAKSISLADATVLFNTSPLFIPIIAYFWGGLKIFHRLWWGMGLGFLGVLFILHPGNELFNTASVIGLFSGITASITYVGGRYLSYTEPPLRNMFYYFAVGTLIALVIVLATTQSFSHVFHLKSLLLLIGIGVGGYYYQLFFNHGTKLAPVRLTSSFLYFGVIFSIILDWFFWHMIPSKMSILGISCIILGACLMLFLYPKEDYIKRK